MAPIDCYTTSGNDLLTCALDDLVGAAGGDALFGVLIGGTALFALWWVSDGDLALPAVVAILSGALLTSVLPSEYDTIAKTVMFLGLAAGIYAVGKTYVLERRV